MKKAYIYIICFCSLVIFFSGSYYLSYKAALIQFNQKATEKKNQIIQTVEKNRIQEEEDVAVDAVTKDTVKPSTKYSLEVYNLQDNTLTKDTLPTPGFLIGRTREDIIIYLSEYMRKVPLEDYDKGLVSYELISLSSSDVVLRKTYNSDNVLYKYYIIVLDSYVTVYYSDKETVYEYTEIEATNLSEEDQNQLVDGIYVKDEEELYGILENYTS